MLDFEPIRFRCGWGCQAQCNKNIYQATFKNDHGTETQSTCLTGGDVDSDLLFRGRAQIGHPVHRLYAEGVVGVGQ